MLNILTVEEIVFLHNFEAVALIFSSSQSCCEAWSCSDSLFLKGLFIYERQSDRGWGERERERDGCSGRGWSILKPRTPPGPPTGSWTFSVLSQAHEQGTELEVEWLGLEPGLLSWDARVTDCSFTSCGVALTPLSCHMCPFLVALGKLRDHECDSPHVALFLFFLRSTWSVHSL